jgi:hypothetical protein
MSPIVRRHAHTGNPVEDFEVRCVGPSREYGRKRTTHYGICRRCGWVSARHTRAAAVHADYERHLREWSREWSKRALG